ncbi:NAD-dependent epimerase/dehydratase family protein [Sulfitobacter faviae]|uniref:NAD-dependent epimerase/dehydratase family protein n=1 Tax=Sulfitobacter faviae TaxID=1775881 RepID=A0ABZ0UWI5_9RHOB|nr:NAD-dependent epimerase/dehydratase family protein [Sulfitobacter faviae]WPZ20977.1 NAD-dependent epimerase/dehydratase family protein [Sulfitobacter faviae]
METSDKPVVVVTGSSGYLGAAVVKRLHENYCVVGLDRSSPPHPPHQAECICFDITDQGSVDKALARLRLAYGDRIAACIHLAAFFDLSGEDDPAYDAVTVEGSKRLLKGLQDFELGQFIFTSTMLAHAPATPGDPIDEGAPFDPKLPYRASKIRTEAMLREEKGDEKLVLMRPAGIYDDDGHSTFLAHQISRIHEKRLSGKVYPGDLSRGQAFLHLDDLLDAIERIIDRRQSLPEVFPVLLGEADPIPFGELQRLIGRELHGEDWVTWNVPPAAARLGAWAENRIFGEDAFIRAWMVDISSDHYELDLSQAKEHLGWTPKHSLRQDMPLMLQKLKDDPYHWYEDNGLNAARVSAAKVEQAAEKAAAETKDESVADQQSVVREHDKHMRMMHFQMLWVHWLVAALGLWLATAPSVFGTFDPTEFSAAVQRVTEDRGLWAASMRSLLTAWNNVFTGLAITALAFISMKPGNGWAQWANAALGVWLLAAPLVFWTPDPAVYANDTLIGALVIALTILIPMMPGMSREGMADDGDIPPGWTYCPSTYVQRLPIIALGVVGFLLSRILSAYQLGHIDAIWEPFFFSPSNLNGSEYIVTSDVSKAWPIADGGLGAMSYMFEILMGVMGSRMRWRTMPWMVALFGIVVGPLGVISIYFIIIQPIAIGTYCTICLLAAAAMLIMIPFSLDEIVAMVQFMVWNTRRGRPFWRAFFRGDALPGSSEGGTVSFDTSPREIARQSARGVTVPWTLGVSAAIGLLLMLSRAIFGNTMPIAGSDHLVGALVLTTAVIAWAEVARPLRFLNIAFGLWMIVAPWVLSGGTVAGSMIGMLSGIALIALSLPRGKRSAEHYGSWDRYIV